MGSCKVWRITALQQMVALLWMLKTCAANPSCRILYSCRLWLRLAVWMTHTHTHSVMCVIDGGSRWARWGVEGSDSEEEKEEEEEEEGS